MDAALATILGAIIAAFIGAGALFLNEILKERRRARRREGAKTAPAEVAQRPPGVSGEAVGANRATVPVMLDRGVAEPGGPGAERGRTEPALRRFDGVAAVGIGLGCAVLRVAMLYASQYVFLPVTPRAMFLLCCGLAAVLMVLRLGPGMRFRSVFACVSAFSLFDLLLVILVFGFSLSPVEVGAWFMTAWALGFVVLVLVCQHRRIRVRW